MGNAGRNTGKMMRNVDFQHAVHSFRCSGKRLLQCDDCSKCQFWCDLPWKRKCRKCGKRCCGDHTSCTLDSGTAVLEYASKTVCVDCKEVKQVQCQGRVDDPRYEHPERYEATFNQ